MVEDINVLMMIARTIIISSMSLKIIFIFMGCQTGGTTVPAAILKARKVLGAGVIASVLPELLPFFAGAYFNSSTVSSIVHASNGPLRLMNSVTGVLLTMEPGVVCFYAGKELVAWKFESEDYAKSEHIKKVKIIVGCGVLIICGTGLVNTIFDYYI